MSEDLPEGWKWSHFDDVAKVASDLIDPTLTPDAPHVAPNHVESWSGVLLEKSSVRQDEVMSPKHRFRTGQIVYSKIRPYLAKAILANFDGLCSADMYPIDSFIDSRYLHRWILSPEFTRRASQNQGRTVLPKINQDALIRLPVPVPPLPEQRRIVEKIEALMERSRRAREALNALPALIDRYRQSLLAAAFRGDLTVRSRGVSQLAPTDLDPLVQPLVEAIPLPDGWVWRTLRSIINPARPLCYGVVQPGDDEPAGNNLIRVCDLDNGTIATESLRRISASVDIQYRRSKVKAGDVLLSIVGTIGRISIVPDQVEGANIARALARIAIIPEIPSRWVAYWLSTPLMQNWLTNEAREVARKTLNLGTLELVPVPVAAPAEMNDTVKHFDRLSEGLVAATRSIGLLHSNLSTLDQSILAKAFRGELVPQDPNDEPASVLLARIRAERAAQGDRPRRGRRKAGARDP